MKEQTATVFLEGAMVTSDYAKGRKLYRICWTIEFVLMMLLSLGTLLGLLLSGGLASYLLGSLGKAVTDFAAILAVLLLGVVWTFLYFQRKYGFHFGKEHYAFYLSIAQTFLCVFSCGIKPKSWLGFVPAALLLLASYWMQRDRFLVQPAPAPGTAAEQEASVDSSEPR